MKKTEVTLRCFAEKEGDQWVVYCLDLSLVAQAGSLEEARRKLDAQVVEYAQDALVGEDRDHGDKLMSRRAPLSTFLRYWRVRASLAVAGVLHPRRLPQAERFQERISLPPRN
jgi:hypothetical protein